MNNIAYFILETGLNIVVQHNRLRSPVSAIHECVQLHTGDVSFFHSCEHFLTFGATFFLWSDFFLWREFFSLARLFFLWHDFFSPARLFLSGATFFSLARLFFSGATFFSLARLFFSGANFFSLARLFSLA